MARAFTNHGRTAQTRLVPAVVDLDATSTLLRVSTSLDGAQLHKLVAFAGFPVALADVQQLPSECCGGCGG